MKKETRDFCRNVALTTALSFSLLTFFYLGMLMFLNPDLQSVKTLGKFAGYIFGKLLCLFGFSLCLGFLNRIFALKKSRALLRIIHLLATFAAYFIFLILLFYSMFDASGLTTQGVLINVIYFALFYPLTLGVTAIGRAIFGEKKPKERKSILD